MEPWLLSWLQMVALITGILGQWLVARRRRSAFLVWSVSNVVLIWLQLVQGLNVLAAMFGIYLVLCLYAYWEWGRTARHECA